MNGTELAAKLKTSTRMVKFLLDSGIIKATKEKGAWSVDPESFKEFSKKNAAKVKKLKAEYVALYWQGLTVEQLQNRVKDDFLMRGIVYPVPGFAEIAIYESLMREKRERLRLASEGGAA